MISLTPFQFKVIHVLFRIIFVTNISVERLPHRSFLFGLKKSGMEMHTLAKTSLSFSFNRVVLLHPLQNHLTEWKISIINFYILIQQAPIFLFDVWNTNNLSVRHLNIRFCVDFQEIRVLGLEPSVPIFELLYCLCRNAMLNALLHHPIPFNELNL